jgi:hypothetical protein
MAKIKVEIDTEDTMQQGGRLAAGKIGLLASIPLSTALIDAFEYGANIRINDRKLDESYQKSKLKTAKDALDTAGCNVVATVGGSVVFGALVGDNGTRPFVSLLGGMPGATVGQCYGGVSLESWKSNKDRIAVLVGKSHARTAIGLYRNPNSEMAGAENTDWVAQTPIGSVIGFSGANSNDPSKFAVDFASAAMANLTAVVISADPYFQANKEPLIAAANTWVAGGANRYVLYPLQDYRNAGGVNKPTAGKGGAYGPSLAQAYRLLGFIAKQVADFPTDRPGFYTVGNQMTEF